MSVEKELLQALTMGNFEKTIHNSVDILCFRWTRVSYALTGKVRGYGVLIVTS
jgi:hypothetical protein